MKSKSRSTKSRNNKFPNIEKKQKNDNNESSIKLIRYASHISGVQSLSSSLRNYAPNRSKFVGGLSKKKSASIIAIQPFKDAESVKCAALSKDTENIKAVKTANLLLDILAPPVNFIQIITDYVAEKNNASQAKRDQNKYVYFLSAGNNSIYYDCFFQLSDNNVDTYKIQILSVDPSQQDKPIADIYLGVNLSFAASPPTVFNRNPIELKNVYKFDTFKYGVAIPIGFIITAFLDNGTLYHKLNSEFLNKMLRDTGTTIPQPLPAVINLAQYAIPETILPITPHGTPLFSHISQRFLDLRDMRNLFDSLIIRSNINLEKTTNKESLNTYRQIYPTESGDVGSINSIDQCIDDIDDQVKKDAAKNCRMLYGIIRSFIDWFHDLEQNASKFTPVIYSHIINTFNLQQPQKNIIYAAYSKIYNFVVTSGGNVSQINCRKIWEEYAIEYRTCLNLPEFPISILGNIGVCDIYKNKVDRTEYTSEFIALINKLYSELGVKYFYLEAQNFPVATALTRAGFKNIFCPAAERDAGSGFSVATFNTTRSASGTNFPIPQSDNDPPLIVIQSKNKDSYGGAVAEVKIAGANGNPNNENAVINYGGVGYINVTTGPNSSIANSLFGRMVHIKLEATCTVNDSTISHTANNFTLTSNTTPPITITAPNPTQGGKIEKFGLNIMIATMIAYLIANGVTDFGLVQTRGEGNASGLTQIVYSPTPTLTTPDERRLFALSAAWLISIFKSYTDPVQYWLCSMVKQYCITLECSSDLMCALSSAHFEGLLTCQISGNNITVTGSDMRYFQLSQEDIILKFNVMNNIYKHRDLILNYINVGFANYRKILNEQLITNSPSNYYATVAALDYIGVSEIDPGLHKNVIATLTNTLINIAGIIQAGTPMNSDFLRQFPKTVAEYVIQLSQFSTIESILESTEESVDDLIEYEKPPGEDDTIIKNDGIRFILKVASRATPDQIIKMVFDIKKKLLEVLPKSLIETDEAIYIHIKAIIVYILCGFNKHNSDGVIFSINSAIYSISTGTRDNLLSNIEERVAIIALLTEIVAVSTICITTNDWVRNKIDQTDKDKLILLGQISTNDEHFHISQFSLLKYSLIIDFVTRKVNHMHQHQLDDLFETIKTDLKFDYFVTYQTNVETVLKTMSGGKAMNKKNTRKIFKGALLNKGISRRIMKVKFNKHNRSRRIRR